MKTRTAPLFAIFFSLSAILAGCVADEPTEIAEETPLCPNLSSMPNIELPQPSAGDKVAIIETEFLKGFFPSPVIVTTASVAFIYWHLHFSFL